MEWAYGVTTVPERIDTTLPRTLKSLRSAGFDNPRLFVDSCKDPQPYKHLYGPIEVTARWPRVRTAGNWILSLWELYLRKPSADRYAIFQDDFVTYSNLREYLERSPYPKDGYQNLLTFPDNQKIAPDNGLHKGWYKANQRGRGAVALVFNKESVKKLLAAPYLVSRVQCEKRGWKAVDAAIVRAMNNAGIKEYVHNPSLVQHIGEVSSMGNNKHPKSPSFMGEDFDALDLLKSEKTATEPVFRKTHLEEEISMTKDRIGLVGFNTRTGLGEVNRQLAKFVPLHKWLITPHPRKGNLPAPKGLSAEVCRAGEILKMRRFVESINVLLFVETPHYRQLVEIAQSLGKRVICIPMFEWLPKSGPAANWVNKVDLFICPTQCSYDVLSADKLPCTFFSWPIDVERFGFQPRNKVSQFVFINGNGGWKGRKGGDVIRRAKQLWPDMPLTIVSQTKEVWSANTTVLSEFEDNTNLYSPKLGDVLICPHSIDGLGLEPMEAIASGMPVVVPAGAPWSDIPAIARIESTSTRRMVKREVDWYSPSAEHLVEICKGLLGKDISDSSIEGRKWAESHAFWPIGKVYGHGRACTLMEVITYGTSTKGERNEYRSNTTDRNPSM